MPATYEPIATTTLSSAASTITFSSIPNTFTDLRLVVVGIQSANYLSPTIIFNSDSGSNYSGTQVIGTGSSAISNRTTSATRLGDDSYFTGSASIPNLVTFDIFSYAGSTYKSALWTYSIDANSSGTVIRGVGLWRSTSAITSVTINNAGWGTNLGIGTTATLYGILKA